MPNPFDPQDADHFDDSSDETPVASADHHENALFRYSTKPDENGWWIRVHYLKPGFHASLFYVENWRGRWMQQTDRSWSNCDGGHWFRLPIEYLATSILRGPAEQPVDQVSEREPCPNPDLEAVWHCRNCGHISRDDNVPTPATPQVSENTSCPVCHGAGRKEAKLGMCEYCGAVSEDSSSPANKEQDLGKPEVSSDNVQAVLQKILPLLAVTGERLRTQDNRCTSNPMFCVQEKVTIYGMDPRWSDDIVWIEIDDGVREIKPPRNRRETDRVQKSAKKSYWHTVMAAFTQEGCKEYLALNGHNHRGETRIYVESWNRCPEMVAIRSALMEATSVSDRSGEHAVRVSLEDSPSPAPPATGNPTKLNDAQQQLIKDWPADSPHGELFGNDEARAINLTTFARQILNAAPPALSVAQRWAGSDHVACRREIRTASGEWVGMADNPAERDNIIAAHNASVAQQRDGRGRFGMTESRIKQ